MRTPALQQRLLGLAVLFLLVTSHSPLATAQVAPVATACANTKNCTVPPLGFSGPSPVWNFNCGVLQIGGVPVACSGSGGGGGGSIPLTGAAMDGQVAYGSGSGSTFTLTSCALVGCAFVTGDAGKSFGMRTDPAPPPVLSIPGQQCSNGQVIPGTTSCTGTGTLGDATTGTVSVTLGSALVTWASGSGFVLANNAWQQQAISIGGTGYTISIVQDAKHLLLTVPYAAASSAGASYIGPSPEQTVWWKLTYVTASGDGAPSLEGATNFLAGSPGMGGLQIVSPASLSGSTQYKVWAVIDPPFSVSSPETTYPGIMSGQECYQGTFTIGSAAELDSLAACTQQNVAVTSIGRTSGVVTVTPGSNPALTVGESILIQNVTLDPSLNGCATILTRSTITPFSFTFSSPNFADSVGGITSGPSFSGPVPPCARWTSGTISSVNVGAQTAALSVTLPNTSTGMAFAWGTPDNTAWNNAVALYDANHGGCIGVPAGKGFSYITPPGIGPISAPYPCVVGSGSASGYVAKLATILGGLPYQPTATSEIGIVGNTPAISFVSNTAPFQNWAGPVWSNMGCVDPLNGVAAGCVYMESINDATFQNDAYAYFSKWGAYGIMCNADAPTSFCQYHVITTQRGRYNWSGIRYVGGRSSQIKLSYNDWQGSSTGGGYGVQFDCNGGATGGGNNAIIGDHSIYFPVGYFVCDQNAGLFFPNGEDTYSITTPITGHAGLGVGFLLIGSGNVGPTFYEKLLGSGVSESGSTVTMQIATGGQNLPASFAVGNLIQVFNVPIGSPCTADHSQCGYNGGPFQITSSTNPSGSTPAEIQWTSVFTGLGATGGGTVATVNTSQKNNVGGLLTNFEYGLVVGCKTDAAILNALNLGPDNHNQLAVCGTDVQEFTNQGLNLQVIGTPAIVVGPSTSATPCQTASFEVDVPTPNAFSLDCGGAAVGINSIFPAYNIENIANDSGGPGTFLNTVAAFDSNQLANLYPHAGGDFLGIVSPSFGGIAGAVAGTIPTITVLGSANAYFDGSGSVTANHYASPSSAVDGGLVDVGTSPGNPKILIKQSVTNIPAPSPVTGTGQIGTGSLSGDFYLQEVCVNPLGGFSLPTESAVITFTAGQNVIQDTSGGTGCRADAVGYLLYADHATGAGIHGSGNEVLQTMSSPLCGGPLAAVNGVAACAIGDHWSSGGIVNPSGSACPVNGGTNVNCAPQSSTAGGEGPVELLP